VVDTTFRFLRSNRYLRQRHPVYRCRNWNLDLGYKEFQVSERMLLDSNQTVSLRR